MYWNGRSLTNGFKNSGKKSIGTIPPEKKVNNAYLKSMKGNISTNQKASNPAIKLSMETRIYPAMNDTMNTKHLVTSNGMDISKRKIDIIIIGAVLAII
jgi:hypothetical protein